MQKKDTNKSINRKNHPFKILNPSPDLNNSLYEFIHRNTVGWVVSAYKRKYLDTSREFYSRSFNFKNRDKFQTDEGNGYFSINTFLGYRRIKNDIKELTALYIDLDTYHVGISKKEALDLLKTHYFNKRIPYPSAIVDSGNGLYLIWKFKDVQNKSFIHEYDKYQRYLLLETLELGGDKQCLDASRVLRNTGVKNTKDPNDIKVSYFVEKHEDKLYTPKDIERYYQEHKEKRLELLDQKFEDSKDKTNGTDTKDSKGIREKKPRAIEDKTLRAQSKRINKYKKLISKEAIDTIEKNITLTRLKERRFTHLTLALARAQDLEKLVELRNYNIEGYSNTLFTAYIYSLFVVYGDFNYVAYKSSELNNTIKYPISERDLDDKLSSIEKMHNKAKTEKKNLLGMAYGYNYKNKTLIEALHITDDEQKHMKFVITKEEASLRRTVRENKARRNENGLTKREQKKLDTEKSIINLIRAGYNKTEIARELNISRQGLYRYSYVFEGEKQCDNIFKRDNVIEINASQSV